MNFFYEKDLGVCSSKRLKIFSDAGTPALLRGRGESLERSLAPPTAQSARELLREKAPGPTIIGALPQRAGSVLGSSHLAVVGGIMLIQERQ